MLTILAYTMIVVFMALIMTKRLSAMVALILVPIVFGLMTLSYAGAMAMAWISRRPAATALA